MRIVKRLKIVLPGDIEAKPGDFQDLQELLSCEQFLGTESQSNTVKICLINFRSVQNKYQETLMNTIVVATKTWLNNKTVGNTVGKTVEIIKLKP